MKKILLLLAVALIASSSFGATHSNKGKHKKAKHGKHSQLGSPGMMH
jgi:hypothetical protein